MSATDVKLTLSHESAKTPATIGARGRVLVIDDEPAVLGLSKAILKSAGLIVETAASGTEAIEKLSKTYFDAVVTDYRMPGEISGADLYDWVRQHRPGLEAQMIFMTGDAIGSEIHSLFEASGTAVVLKPFDPEEFLGRIDDAVALSRRGPGARPASRQTN